MSGTTRPDVPIYWKACTVDSGVSLEHVTREKGENGDDCESSRLRLVLSVGILLSLMTSSFQYTMLLFFSSLRLSQSYGSSLGAALEGLSWTKAHALEAGQSRDLLC
jgi:hypothetical protein